MVVTCARIKLDHVSSRPSCAVPAAFELTAGQLLHSHPEHRGRTKRFLGLGDRRPGEPMPGLDAWVVLGCTEQGCSDTREWWAHCRWTAGWLSQSQPGAPRARVATPILSLPRTDG